MSGGTARWLSIAVVALLCAGAARSGAMQIAQFTQAAIRRVIQFDVLDRRGRPASHQEIQVTGRESASGRMFRLTTDQSGMAQLYDLPAGKYDVVAGSSGRKTIEVTDDARVQKHQLKLTSAADIKFAPGVDCRSIPAKVRDHINPEAALAIRPDIAKAINWQAARTITAAGAANISAAAARVLNPDLARVLTAEQAKNLTPDQARRAPGAAVSGR